MRNAGNLLLTLLLLTLLLLGALLPARAAPTLQYGSIEDPIPEACSIIPIEPYDFGLGVYTLESGDQAYEAWVRGDWYDEDLGMYVPQVNYAVEGIVGGIEDLIPMGDLPFWGSGAGATILASETYAFFNKSHDEHAEVIFCPTDMATATPTPTPTEDTSGACLPGDFYCDYGIGSTWAMGISGGAMGSEVKFFSLDDAIEEEIATEPGAWDINIDCDIQGTSQHVNVRMVWQDGGDGSDYLWRENLDPDNNNGDISFKYAMPIPDAAHAGYGNRQMAIRAETYWLWPDDGSASYNCTLSAIKEHNNNRLWESADTLRYRIYDSKQSEEFYPGVSELDSQVDVTSSAQLCASQEIDTSWQPKDADSAPTDYQLDVGGQIRTITANYPSENCYTPGVADRLRLTITNDRSALSIWRIRFDQMDVDTPTPTVTNTSAPTASPQPPCELISIDTDRSTTIDWISPVELYQWAGEIDYLLNGSSAGQLQEYSTGAPLMINDGDQTIFTPQGNPPLAEFLLCTVTPTVTPTATATPGGTTCEVLHSEYDSQESIHRINFGAYGYESINGGYWLDLLRPTKRKFTVRALGSAPRISTYNYSNPGTYGQQPLTDAWRTYFGNEFGRGWLSIEYPPDYVGGTQPFSIELCDETDDLISPTPTSTRTATPTNTHTATSQPTETDVPDPILPGPPVSTIACVPVPTVPTAHTGPLPDLSISLPTFAPIPTPVTGTITADISLVQTAVISTMNQVRTPQAAVSTAVAPYSYASGVDAADEWMAYITPILAWLAIVNPGNPAYEIEGGPLWALKPVLVPLMPIIFTSMLIAFVRFFVWLLDWLRKALEFLFRLIELIPGE
jgi:hypothetical protein